MGWARILSRFRDRRHFALIFVMCGIQEWFDWKRRSRNFIKSNWGIWFCRRRRRRRRVKVVMGLRR